MSNNTIKGALDAMLDNASLGYPIAWPAYDFLPPDSGMWLEVAFAPNTDIDNALAYDSGYLSRGFYQVSIFSRKGLSSYNPGELAAIIKNIFRKGTRIIDQVMIVSRPDVMPMEPDDSKIGIAVSIEYTGHLTPEISRYFYSSFETVEDFAGYFVTPSPHMGTSYQTLSNEIVRSGKLAHKAWIDGANPPSSPGINNNHRGYPTMQFYKDKEGAMTGPIRVSFWVWLDIDLSGESGIPEENWFSFATFTDDDSDDWDRTVLINLSKSGLVHFQHTTGPGQSDIVYQNTELLYPQQEWVHLEAYLDFSVGGYAKVWQNGTLMSHANIANIDDRVAQCHFGLYCPPQLTSGTCYNDDLSLRMVKGEDVI